MPYGDRYVPMSYFDSLADARKSLKEKSLLSLEWQIDLLDWLRTTTSHYAYTNFMRSYGYKKMDEEHHRQVMGQWLHDQVKHAAETSPTYYVSGDMCEMVRMGAAELDVSEGLQPEDLPTDQGFLVFDRPMKIYGPGALMDAPDIEGEDIMISAILWVQGEVGQVDPFVTGVERSDPTAPTQTAPGVKYWLFLTPHDSAVAYNMGQKRSAEEHMRRMGVELVEPVTHIGEDGKLVEWMTEHKFRQDWGPLNIYDFSGWTMGQAWAEVPYGDPEGQGYDEGDQIFHAHPIVNQVRRILLSTWRLLGQKIVHTEINNAPRALRRRAGRFMPCDGDILIIRLRREYSPRAQLEALGETGEVWWTHRWTVRGHWRRPKGSAPDAPKSEWVCPYVKGPAHLPLITKDKVFSLEN